MTSATVLRAEPSLAPITDIEAQPSLTSLLAQATPRQTLGVGDTQVLQPWGEGTLYQVYTRNGNFELRWRANEPTRFKQSDFLVFESRRPLDLQRDVSGGGNFPWERDNSSPLRRELERVLKEAHADSNRIAVPQPPGTPMSDNPLVRFYRGAGGAVRGLTGDTVEFLARIAIYMPSGNGMTMPMPITPESAQALAQTRQIQMQTSTDAGDAVARFNDVLGFAMGLPPDSPEVTFGRIAIGVAEGVEGLVGLGRGALALLRHGDDMLLVVRNAQVLDRLASPNPQQLGQTTRWVDQLTPEQYGALPAEVRQALRQGLLNNAGDAGATRALRRLDSFEQPGGNTGSGVRPRDNLPPAAANAANAANTSTPPADAALARYNRQLEVVGNYTRQIGNPIVRNNVSALAQQALHAGDELDLARLAQIRQQVENSLALNTRRQIADATFTDPEWQAALRQRLADQAGTDPSRNASLANSPQWVQSQAQDIALDRLDGALFNGSGVPQGARDAWRTAAQSWAQQALPSNPAQALEQLAAQPAWQQALLREIAISRIAGFDHASLGALARTSPDAARELATLRQRVAGALDNGFYDASGLKNLLASGGTRARVQLLRDAVAQQIGGDSPLAAAVQRHAINQGTGERALVDLLTSPQSRVNFMKEALVNETLRAPGQKLNRAEQARLRGAIEARLAELGSDAARMQYLKDLSNSSQTLGRLTAPPTATATATPTPASTPTTAVVPPSASTRAPDPVPPDPQAQPPRDTRPTDPPGATAPTLPEQQLAGGVFQRGNQIVLRSPDLEVVLPPGYRFGPIEGFANLGGEGSGYTTISGHGTLMPNALRQANVPTLVTVPEGTRVVLLTPPGAVLGSRLGGYIDNRSFTVNYGIDTPHIVPIRVPYRVLEAGQTLPNAVVTPPNGLNIPNRPDVITVSDEQQARALSQMLKPNMGTVVINICAPVQGAPRTRWSNLQFEEFGVVNPYSLKRTHYGLPAAGDAPPPADPRSRSTPPPADEPTPPPDEPTPPLDPSDWNLTMGQSVFGKLPEPSNPLPWPTGLGRDPLAPTPALQMTDPITGQPLQLDPSGRIVPTAPTVQSPVTARQLGVDELTLPQRAQLDRVGFQRFGPRFSIKVGDYSVIVDMWGQRDPNQVVNLSQVLAALRSSGQGQAVTSSSDLAERIAQTLAERAPPGWGWAVKAGAPGPTAGSNTAGVNLGNYIEIGDLQSAVDRGAVLYDPAAPLGARYRLNTTTNAAGEPVMVVPLEVTLGWRSAVAPTSLPGVPPLPVKVSFSRASETKLPLSGPLNAELLEVLNAGLNNPLGSQVWHDAGTLGVRSVRQINFALPGMLPREGAYNLPQGWTRLETELLTPAQRDNPNAWSTFTKATGSAGGSLFGIGGQLGFSTERVERLATDFGPLITQTYDQPAPGGALARPSSVTPFTFIAGTQGGSGNYTLTEILPDAASALRAQGQYVQPDVNGRLIVPQRGTLTMPGSVLNTLNGFAVEASDIARIVSFLRSLDPAGTSGQANAQQVFDIVSRLRIGQPLDSPGIDLLRDAIRRYAEPAQP